MAGALAPPVLMTVAGPLQPSEVRSEGPMLCREWLPSDQSALLEPPRPCAASAEGDGEPRPRAGDRVELGDLLAMRRWPLAALHNLHLSVEDADNELRGPLRQRHGAASLVVACAPRAYWTSADPGERGAALRALSSRAGVPVVAGTAPAPGRPASEAELEAEVSRLVTDLAIGFEAPAGAAASDERVRPGLLGELPLWPPSNAPPPASEVLALRACAEAQRRTGAPLLLSGAVAREALAVLEGVCVWEKCAFFDVPPDSPVPASELAARGAYLGFCPPAGAADIAWQPYPCRRPWRTEEAFLAAAAGGPPGRTLVSSGLRFRTDLASYGGPGLAHAFDLAAMAEQGHLASGPGARLPEGKSLRGAAVAFLQYPWKPPIPPEMVVRNIQCHWCGAEKKEGDHFSKLGFDYCAPKCIAKHRQVDFAPDKHARG